MNKLFKLFKDLKDCKVSRKNTKKADLNKKESTLDFVT